MMAEVERDNIISKIDFHLRKYLADYANNATIHGIKYVFTEGKNLFTR